MSESHLKMLFLLLLLDTNKVEQLLSHPAKIESKLKKDLLCFAQAQVEFAYSKNVAVTNCTRNFQIAFENQVILRISFSFYKIYKIFMVLYSRFVDPPKLTFLKRTLSELSDVIAKWVKPTSISTALA